MQLVKKHVGAEAMGCLKSNSAHGLVGDVGHTIFKKKCRNCNKNFTNVYEEIMKTTDIIVQQRRNLVHNCDLEDVILS
jgi:hypothetical protein